MGCLHGQGHADTERGQRHHWCGPYSDEHHLAKNRAEFEKLAGERGNEHPVEQTKIKLEIIFQAQARPSAECQGVRIDESRKITPSPIARRLGGVAQINPRLRKSPKFPPLERSIMSMVNLRRQTSQASSTP